MAHNLSHSEYADLFVPPDSISRDEHVIVHYRLRLPPNAKVEDIAATIAVLISVGTTRPVFGETASARATVLARVLGTNPAGFTTIAIPLAIIGATASVAELLTTLWFPAEYNFIEGLSVQDVELPKAMVTARAGPRVGTDRIRDGLGIHDRPILGAILKPRAGVPSETLADAAYEALLGGADYVIDDELIVDPGGVATFEKRVGAIVAAKTRAEADTKERKWYVVNVGGTPHRAIVLTRRAAALGASGVLVNAFTLGFSALEDIAAVPDLNLPVFTSNMGTALMSRGDGSGTAEGVMVKLSRLAGADGVYTGILGSSWYNNDVIQSSLAALRSPFHGLRRSFPIVAGGLTIANLFDNIVAHWPDVMLQAGSSLFGFPSGPRLGAQVFRQLIGKLRPGLHKKDVDNELIELGRKNAQIRAALVSAGFGHG
jgi:ribulose 1,5-bisphosphate carboxylase large subunit-like protein